MLRVDLTIYDIVRIVSLENKQVEEFIDTTLARDDDPNAFRVLGKKAKFSLKQHSDASCIFLTRKKSLKCLVEDAKPAICLQYPFNLHNGQIFIRNDALCPPQNQVAVDLKKMSKKTLEDCYWEWNKHREFVADWNAITSGNESPNDFLYFSLRQLNLESYPLGSAYRKIRGLFLTHKLFSTI
ncbi:hypothetical protein KKB44_04500 [Candidatus Micrarchaeota archaeon]|nr:hypothetical protein [Candidatus Micrarchaeota archaeon]